MYTVYCRLYLLTFFILHWFWFLLKAAAVLLQLFQLVQLVLAIPGLWNCFEPSRGRKHGQQQVCVGKLLWGGLWDEVEEGVPNKDWHPYVQKQDSLPGSVAFCREECKFADGECGQNLVFFAAEHVSNQEFGGLFDFWWDGQSHQPQRWKRKKDVGNGKVEDYAPGDVGRLPGSQCVCIPQIWKVRQPK